MSQRTRDGFSQVRQRIVMLLVALAWPAMQVAHAQANASVLHREGWTFDRSLLAWPDPTKVQEQKQKGSFQTVVGWAEYDFELPASGWYTLWEKAGTPGWSRDVFIDGKMVFPLTLSLPEDTDPASPEKSWYKEANLYLEQGKHSVRFRRLAYPGVLPSAWELRASDGDAAGTIRATPPETNVVRLGETVKVAVTGGTSVATSYELVLRNEKTEEMTPAGTVEFPICTTPVQKEIDLKFPAQGMFTLLAKVNGNLLRPADLKGGSYVVVDAKPPEPEAGEIKTTTVVDIDCTANPPAQGFWEKDGKTRVVQASFGAYRESSGQGTATDWGTDGFSYQFDLPDDDHVYRLRVDYPDDDRRSMGFWINDGAGMGGGKLGTVGTGGVETGDRYILQKKLQTYQAFFYPRNDKGLIVAVLNLVPGMKAAAAHIRIDRVDSALPAGPGGIEGGRTMGFYFEEPGRWLKFFGGKSEEIPDQLQALDRWGQWNRYIGANLMYPTINVYQGNHYPSRILEGYFNHPINEVRMVALMAEKYGSKIVPEFHMSGQTWFDRQVMGVWTEADAESGRKAPVIKFASKDAEDCVIRDRDGGYKFSVEPFVYNVLNPKVQDMYISVLGELADSLGDCKSFEGISSRMMFGWVWQGWNALPGLNWGYDDWTVSQFERDTGINVPGELGDAGRFRKRFDNLTGPNRDQWINWRCAKVFEYHQRLRDRIQKAKPTAKLFFTYTGPASGQAYSTDILGQLRENGIDASRYAHEPGIVILPSGFYGRRFSTTLQDADKLDPLYDPGVETVSRLGDRGFEIYSDYFEVNKHLDWSQLGGKPYAAFDTCVPAGNYEREIYATALANSDVSYLVSGGSGWIFGTPEIMQPFLREYRALPAVPFEPVSFARDPVAMWQHKDKEGTLWFYAVNRLAVPVSVELKMGSADARVVSASSGRALKSDAGKIKITLEPFMVNSFRATGGDLTGCEVVVPTEFVDKLRSIIHFAKLFQHELVQRHLVPELTAEDALAAINETDEAVQAFDKGEYWRARGNLQRVALVRAYYASGYFPPGLLERSLPLGVPGMLNTMVNAQVSLASAPEHMESVSDLGYDDSGNLWVSSGQRLLQFDAQGHYIKMLGLFAPYIFDAGDIRHPTLIPPERLSISGLKAFADHLVVQQGTDAPLSYDAKTGRAQKMGLNYAYPVPALSCQMLAADGTGDLLVSVASGERKGVYKIEANGRSSHRVADAPASGGAFDSSGRMYLADSAGLTVLSGKGESLEKLSEVGLGEITVSKDGNSLVATKDKGMSVVCFQRGGNGSFVKKGEQSFSSAVTALDFGSGTNLALGFRQAVEGSVAREYRIGTSGLEAKRDLVLGLSDSEKTNLDGPTQLKVSEGNLYYAAHGKLMRVTVGSADKVEVAFDPGFSPDHTAFEAFAFSPNGDLYLSSNWNGTARGVNLYLCKKTASGWEAPVYLNEGKPLVSRSNLVVSDLAVDAQSVVLRLLNPSEKSGGNISLYRWSPDRAPELVIDLGDFEGGAGDYGLCRTADGHLLIAGSTTRGIWSLSPRGDIQFKIQRAKGCPPGYVDLRAPKAITMDSKGGIWATDATRHQILRFNLQGKLLEALGHFGNDDEKGSLALDDPSGIATINDDKGREWLYVADAGNGRLIRFPVQSPIAGNEAQK